MPWLPVLQPLAPGGTAGAPLPGPLLRPASAPPGAGQQSLAAAIAAAQQLGMVRPLPQGALPSIPAPAPLATRARPAAVAPLAGSKRKAEETAEGRPMAPLPMAATTVLGIPMLPHPAAAFGAAAPVLGHPASEAGAPAAAAASPLPLFRPPSAPPAMTLPSGAEPASSSEGEAAAAGLRSLEAAAAAAAAASSDAGSGQHGQHRKARLVWTQELHNRFQNALSHLVRAQGAGRCLADGGARRCWAGWAM